MKFLVEITDPITKETVVIDQWVYQQICVETKEYMEKYKKALEDIIKGYDDHDWSGGICKNAALNALKDFEKYKSEENQDE